MRRGMKRGLLIAILVLVCLVVGVRVLYPGVPDVRGSSNIDIATRALTDAGYHVQVDNTAPVTVGNFSWDMAAVLGEEPRGAWVPRGTVIHLTWNSGWTGV